jgi:release factor glutamine methyltransferase
VSPQPDVAVPASAERAWSVLELLRWTTAHFAECGIETPRLDAECLLAHALGVPRLRLYLDFDKPIAPAERAGFRELVRRRARERVPVAQLVGGREFWSLPLRVTPQVLVPRPETETLVAAALELLPDAAGGGRILDLGTGSGAVALALASERPRATVVATDIAQEALKIAQENAEALGMEARIHFLRGDWEAPLAGPFDCVVANPPYLADAERAGLAPELAHEPSQALFAGPSGLEALERICRRVPALLAAGGGLALELAPGQAPIVQGWLRDAGLATALRRDLAGRVRVVMGRAPAAPPAPSEMAP